MEVLTLETKILCRSCEFKTNPANSCACRYCSNGSQYKKPEQKPLTSLEQFRRKCRDKGIKL